jgi:predicted nucleic acid-binding protein
MRVFFDSSAFAKRYVQEAGSDEVLSWCGRASEIGLSGIALPEIVSVFCRLSREKRINRKQYHALKESLLEDVRDAAICDLSPEVIHHAIIALEKNTLRGMDAIHIGSALALRAEVFVSADQRQCDAAKLAGLRVIGV